MRRAGVRRRIDMNKRLELGSGEGAGNGRFLGLTVLPATVLSRLAHRNFREDRLDNAAHALG